MEDGEIGIGVFSEVEEFLVGGASLVLLASENIGPCETQPCQNQVWGVWAHNPMVNELLKFSYGVTQAIGGQVGFGAVEDRTISSERLRS